MKVTPFLNIKKTDNVADIEIFGDIGYNVWADTYEEYKANTSEQKAEEIKALQNLGVDVINVTLESLGGDVSHALAIYSLLKNSGATINTYYRGVNASASTIIGSAATSVKNIYMDNTGLFLVHKVMSYVEGNENDMQDMINDLEKWQGAINQVYLNLGVEKEVIAELMERNGGHGEYLNFKEAKKYGFVGKEWETKKVANYSRDTFVEKELLVPNFINQKEEKMEETTPVVTEEKTLLQKIWNKISNETEPTAENEVDNEVTPEEQTAIVDEVMQILEPRLVALEEAMAELMPKEEEEDAEEQPMEEEMVEDKKENLSEVIKNEIAEAFKNFVEPTPTKSNKTNSVDEPTWKQHLNNFQNFIK
jgi:ATP-dependent protease ClpP protease subunit